MLIYEQNSKNQGCVEKVENYSSLSTDKMPRT